MTAPDPQVVAAAALAAVQLIQQQGIGRLAPVVTGRTAAVNLPPIQCRTCGNSLADDTWPGYVRHMLANHHSLLEQYASMADVNLPRLDADDPDDIGVVDHEALAGLLADGDWPHDRAARVTLNS